METEDVVKELKKIYKILLFSKGKAIEEELSKLIATNERRKMWVLLDGHRVPRELAKVVNVSPMSVSRFLNLTVSAGLVEYEKGKPPVRMLDYVPAEWVELLNFPEKFSQEVEQ
jgi:hypothetical protein